jgi:hypothetical protein
VLPPPLRIVTVTDCIDVFKFLRCTDTLVLLQSWCLRCACSVLIYVCADSPLHPQVLMATNRIDILDSALLRPGRIDRKIEFPNPSESSRVDILRIHSRKMNLTRGIDLKRIADKMSGSSGAELKACCTEAGMFALRERRVHVTQEDFEMAVAKVRHCLLVCACLILLYFDIVGDVAAVVAVVPTSDIYFFKSRQHF